MFFFFPFAFQHDSPGTANRQPLPMLPVSSGKQRAERAFETAFEDAIVQAGDLAADSLRHALISITSSLTALGNQANLLFSQIAAALAFDRMARQAAPFFGMSWSSFGPYSPQQCWAAGLWPAPFQNAAWFAPLAIPAWPVNLWTNPWPVFAEAFGAWANIWAQHRPAPGASGGNPPFTATLSVPGFSWSLALS